MGGARIQHPREFYADDDVWQAVYKEGSTVLKDSMDLIYLSGQRPQDVVSFSSTHIKGDLFELKNKKTGKWIRIRLTDEAGNRTQFGKKVDELVQRRDGKIVSLHLLLNTRGEPLTRAALRHHFDDARTAAATHYESIGTPAARDLAKRIRQLQFRDGRPKTASDLEDLDKASDLLNHSDQRLTKRVYMRKGKVVSPTK